MIYTKKKFNIIKINTKIKSIILLIRFKCLKRNSTNNNNCHNNNNKVKKLIMLIQ